MIKHRSHYCFYLSIASVLWGLMLLGGCGKEKTITFLVRNKASKDALQGAKAIIWDNNNGNSLDTLITDQEGLVEVPVDLIDQYGVVVGFSMGEDDASAGQVFDEEACCLKNPGHWKAPVYQYVPGGESNILPGQTKANKYIDLAWEEGDQPIGLERFLEVIGVSGATLFVNQNPLPASSAQGNSIWKFCPGDSVACFASSFQLEIVKEGYENFYDTLPLADSGDTIRVTPALKKKARVRPPQPHVAPTKADSVDVWIMSQPFPADIYLNGKSTGEQTGMTFTLQVGKIYDIVVKMKKNGKQVEAGKRIKATKSLKNITVKFSEDSR